VTGPGIGCEDKCSYEFEGSVTLTAIPNPGFIFRSWKGCPAGGTSGHKCTVTPAGQTIGAAFARAPTLTAAKAKGSGSGKLTSAYGVSCAAGCTSTAVSFLAGTKVTLKEASSKHSHFVEWLGDCTGSGPCELLMDEDHEVEALFAQDPKHTLTLTKVGDGQGFVKSKPAGISCPYACRAAEAEFYEGETIVLEAVARKDDTFEGWFGTGGCAGLGACAVSMDKARKVFAEFGPTVWGPEKAHVFEP
jgi:hypothetical protein